MDFFETRLPSHDEIFTLCEKMSDILENEKGDAFPWRPVSSDGTAGGLLDFSNSDIPVLIIPDLHARHSFLKNVLNFRIDGKSVLENLEEKKIHLVFTGDALHSEKTTRERWMNCYKEYENGIFSGPFMKEEMTDGLSLLMNLFLLKISFPENFHFLKGNHENIMNECSGGDFPFRKYVEEGEMVKYFISDYYGDDVLYMLSLYEKNLPLVYVSKNCIVSHAEPRRVFSRQEIVDARLEESVVSGLVWTANNEAEENSVENTARNLLGKKGQGVTWFGGHRPVNGKYAMRQNGHFVQIHNPLLQNIVYIKSVHKFNPENDIRNVLLDVNKESKR